MRNNIERVISKMPNKKQSFKKHNVELNVVSELTSIASSVSVYLKNVEIDFEELERLQSEIDSFKNSLEVDLQDLSDESYILEQKLIEAEDLAKELGVEPSELNQFENSFNLYEEALEKIKTAYSKLNQI
jgi:hypothetical protein